MAGQQGYKTKLTRLVAFLVFICLATVLVRRVTSFPPPPSLSSPRSSWSTRRPLSQPKLNLNADPLIPQARPNPICGRWEAVRASLGLPPLPHEAAFIPPPDPTLAGRPDKRASCFDLGRKRQAEEPARQLPPLHFAPDLQPSKPHHDRETRINQSPPARYP